MMKVVAFNVAFALAIFNAVAVMGMSVLESGGRAEVDTGAMSFSLDLKKGVIEALSVGTNRLVLGNGKSPLFAVVMESDCYDGICDYAPRRFLAAEDVCTGLKIVSTSGVFAVAGAGSLVFPGGDAIDYGLEIKAAEGESRLSFSVSLDKRGQFRNRFIREVGFRQPLALGVRKRVIQAGDQGLRWDTRHWYQYHMHVEVFRSAEQNWWRHFHVDQDTDHSYRIWRAESDDTGALEAFNGRNAAGWMTLYDPAGGALFAYRGLSARAPKTLYADAEGGGEGVVYFYSPTRPAFDPADPRLSSAVFGKPHEIDWIFFAGRESDVMPDRIIARAWGVESLPSDGPTQFKPVADEIDLWNASEAKNENVPLVMGGIPLPRGKVSTADNTRLFVRGRESPLQAKALAYWPDKSIKWLLLIFPLDGDGGYYFTAGKGKGDEATFRVTLRKGADVPCVLHFGGRVKAGIEKSGKSLVSTNAAGAVEVDTGPLRFTLVRGQRWLSSAILNGAEMLSDGGEPQAFVDYLQATNYPVGTTHPEGVKDPGPVEIEKIEIEESGPLRAVVRLEGMAKCAEPAKVIMRIEAYRGRSYFRLFHTAEFMHADPRATFVRRMGLRFPLAISPDKLRAWAGGQDGPVDIKPARSVGLRQTSHVNYEVWRRAEGGKYCEVTDSNHASRGWLGVAGERGGLAIAVRNMWQEAPKEMVFHADKAEFEIGLWPESAPLMDVRRYSNYPHLAQGESADGGNTPWVHESYYKNDPFKGVSRTHELLFHFTSTDAAPAELDAIAADFQSRPLVYAGWPWYAQVGITLPQPDPADQKFTRVNANLARAAEWWMFHQKAWGWYGFWDYGDVRHRFRAGYGRIFPPETLAKLLALPPDEMAKTPLRSLPQTTDYFTQNDWAYDNGRWGWSNTEGLINHFMSLQYLRTGKRDLFFFVEAAARHARDVDARHAGKYFGRGTRHGVQHWSDGNHEERQTTFTEQRFHYFLTGEHRAREWNRDLSDNFYLKRPCSVHADHSGRSYGLLFRWEITGDAELGKTLERYMGAFARPEGIDISPTVVFPEGKLEKPGPDGSLNDGNMFFHNFGAMHALLEYYYITGDERLKKSLIAMADDALKRSEKDGFKSIKNRTAVAFAARHAKDGSPYREALAKALDKRDLFLTVPDTKAHWTGPTAFLTGNVSYGLFWLNDAAYTAGALEGDPALAPEEEKTFRDIESRAVEPEPRAPRESWQTEYDKPEFEKYIRDTSRR